MTVRKEHGVPSLHFPHLSGSVMPPPTQPSNTLQCLLKSLKDLDGPAQQPENKSRQGTSLLWVFFLGVAGSERGRPFPVLLTAAFLTFYHLVHSPHLCQSLSRPLLPGLPEAAGYPWGWPGRLTIAGPLLTALPPSRSLQEDPQRFQFLGAQGPGTKQTE